MDKSSKAFTYSLFILVIVIWAISWPASKIGLQDMPPIWFSALRLSTGFITVFAILLFQKKIKWPSKKDIPLIMSIGLLQMASFLILLNGGLLFVDAGRSAILVYSTPFLVIPIATYFFGEKLSKAKLVGIIFGCLGFLILFNPWSFDWHNKNVVIGNALLLLAAICWAIAMIHTRYGTWHSPSIQLVPWQLLLASIFVIGAGFIVNPHPEIHWNARLLTMSLFTGILATGFAYPAIIYASKKMPVTNTSILLLGVPVLGLLISDFWLGEALTWANILAISFISIGLITVAIEVKQS